MESDSLRENLMKKAQLAESLRLEYQFLNVPFEHYRNSVIAKHTFFNDEISAALSTVNQAADESHCLTKYDAINCLCDVVYKLKTDVKKKLEERTNAEEFQEKIIWSRFDDIEAVNLENLSEWNDKRMNRILLEYMLRSSYYKTAKKLAESTGIKDLLEFEIFDEASKIIDALRNRNTIPALAWCADNGWKLKETESKLELGIRYCEFTQLVIDGDNDRAINYAEQYVKPFGDESMKEVCNITKILMWSSNADPVTHRLDLINEDSIEPWQWKTLIEQFKEEFYSINGLTSKPLLCIYLQAGLSALKTMYPYLVTSCNGQDCPVEDPLSQKSLWKLALPLPSRKEDYSEIVCYITKEAMHAKNPPLALPNGYVYSSKALEDMALKNGGKVTCQRTGFVCDSSELMKIHVNTYDLRSRFL